LVYAELIYGATYFGYKREIEIKGVVLLEPCTPTDGKW